LLGTAQDGGLPQIGCDEPACRAARTDPLQRRHVASLLLVDPRTRRRWLFDATPDLAEQVELARDHPPGRRAQAGRPPLFDGIFLTHAHLGHYTGLMYLGRESIDAKGVPVYATERMAAFLRDNGLWSQLVDRRNIELRVVVPDRAIDLGDGVRVTPMLVPHRDELSDTVGYLIEGPATAALYIPDIDQWQKWPRSIRELADRVDLALLDGTFASAEEIPGRSIADIPHPLMPATRERLRGTRAALWFIHLNHTNRELDAADVVREGQRFGM
jgi:pyrroloquinoline quinone biosynthesis protein B